MNDAADWRRPILGLKADGSPAYTDDEVVYKSGVLYGIQLSPEFTPKQGETVDPNRLLEPMKLTVLGDEGEEGWSVHRLKVVGTVIVEKVTTYFPTKPEAMAFIEKITY